MNKETFNQRRTAIQQEAAEEIEKSRLDRLRRRKISISDNVEAISPIPTDIRGLDIPQTSKGVIVGVGKWLDVYSVNFIVHGQAINVWCPADAIKINSGN